MIGICRYCGCTENAPCVVRLDGPARPCSWLLLDVCDAPACVDKAYNDARNDAEELTRRLEEGLRFEFDPLEAA